MPTPPAPAPPTPPAPPTRARPPLRGRWPLPGPWLGPLSARRREWLGFALLLAGAVAVFALQPRLDIAITARFFDGSRFPANDWRWVQLVYQNSPRLIGLVCLLSLGVLLAGLWRGRRGRVGRGGAAAPAWPRRALQRRATALLLSLVLGVGLAVHAGLKEHWGRPRPDAVQPFGGPVAFQPPLEPGAGCDTNCSFVSGHAAGGFLLAAVGLLASPAHRRRWLLIGLLAGAGIGAVRVIQGRHFTSDIVFCGLVMWATQLLVREAWLRLHLLRRRRARR